MREGRELVWRKEESFEGWACTVCGWLRSNPSLIGNTPTSTTDVGEAFDAHKCAQLPRTRKPREDVNQAAARIVREATKE